MSWYKILMVVGALLCLGLLLPAGPVAAGNCGFSLPCEQTVTNYLGPGLSIVNDGASTSVSGIKGKAWSGPGVLGVSPGTVGVRGEGPVGVIGFSTAGIGVYGLTQSTDLSPTPAVQGFNSGYGPGVEGISGNGTGIIGSSDKGTGIQGEGHTNGVHGQTASATYAGVYGENIGAGPGVKGTSKTGNAGFFQITNASSTFAACRVENSGKGIGAVVRVMNPASSGPALSAKTVGKGKAGEFMVENTANGSYAISATTNGTGWAGYFAGTTANSSRGVYIKTNGGTGLMVSGGTKSAVVPTSKGERALYAEEASEVYFTDYGFGKLQSGKAVIPIDPLFAETVNLHQPYHVFIQSYGHAELVVTKRTPTTFEVCLRDKDTQGDANAEFSYRLVGKRQGFEQARLELAPPAGKDADLAAEKGGEKVALVRE